MDIWWRVIGSFSQTVMNWLTVGICTREAHTVHALPQLLSQRCSLHGRWLSWRGPSLAQIRHKRAFRQTLGFTLVCCSTPPRRGVVIAFGIGCTKAVLANASHFHWFTKLFGMPLSSLYEAMDPLSMDASGILFQSWAVLLHRPLWSSLNPRFAC